MNAMKTCRILILALFAGGCATTTDPASPTSVTLRWVDASDAPSMESTVAEAPESLDAHVLGATSPSSDAVRSTSAQEAAAPPPAPQSPHSFSGGVGIRVRDGDTAFDLMAQYHYYVNPKLDIGAIVDWAMSPIDSLLIAPAAWWHPTDRLTLFGAPGIEFLNGHGGEAALRAGGSYQLMLGKLAVRPFGWYDFVVDRKDSFSFGLAIGV